MRQQRGGETEFFVDFTHVARRASGIERITTGLFSPEALAPLPVTTVRASGGRRRIVMAQWLELPALARAHPRATFIFPGYPPSMLFPIRSVATVVYVHDIFLVTRRDDLNLAGRYYLAPQFRRALRLVRHYLCNSETTRAQLRTVCDPRAGVLLYRPEVSNVFALRAVAGARRATAGPLRVVSVGTVEPRKNFRYGAEICMALSRRLGTTVEYHIIGRNGWGKEWDVLRSFDNVILHGFVDEPQARSVLESADLALCVSHEEGLGLPLLELQHGGLPVVAPSGAVFREVLGESGLFIEPGNPEAAAAEIARRIGVEGWRAAFADASRKNILRWNTLARKDRTDVIAWLKDLSSDDKQEMYQLWRSA